MHVTKCDICKREIKDAKEEIAVSKCWDRFSFCTSCGKPVTIFLKKRKLLLEKKQEIAK